MTPVRVFSAERFKLGGWRQREMRLRGCHRFIGPVLVVALVLALGGCGSPPRRGDAIDEPALRALVAFVGVPGASRQSVETRLGPPRSTYEGGRIVGYRFEYVAKEVKGASFLSSRPYDNLEYVWQAVPPSTKLQAGPQLMIEYDTTGKVVRHGLIR